MGLVEDVTQGDIFHFIDGFCNGYRHPRRREGSFRASIGRTSEGNHGNRFTSCAVREMQIADDDEHGEVFNPLRSRLREGRINL